LSIEQSIELRGRRGRIAVHRWSAAAPRFVAVVAHGYGEHAGRYAHVAERLVAEGAAVYAPDFEGHGVSDGDRARIESIDDLVDELASVYGAGRGANSGAPIVLIGHSLGGLISTRFVQRDRPELAALVLSGPFIGGNPQVEGLLSMDPLPEVPIDPSILSRDPAVGEAYAGDELVYHGPFHRVTLEATFAAVHEDRLMGTIDWLSVNPETRELRIGLFGASTGAAAALVAAARRPDLVRAVVSRGGRPDLAGDALSGVRAPTLLIVGGNDPEVLRLNRAAYARMTAERKLVVVPGATHLFEEPGTLEEVARLAADWFVAHV
jgi:alpha-beta hydrolase superfamily lysophospholipase